MGNKWPLVGIDSLKADEDGSIAIGPFGSRMKADCYVSSGVPVIRGTNLSDTKSFKGDFVFVSDKTADSMMTCNAIADDLVFPHRGAIGEVGIVPNDRRRYMLSTSLMKLRCNRKLANPHFVYYFFRSTDGKHELLKNASTVGTPGIGQPLSSLRSIKLRLPSLAEQDRIADILGTLDDKIELNRRTNETLEAMAKALFKTWFVDFDPVREKAAGRPPAGLDSATDKLFPDSFEDSSLGKIPKGWRVGHLEELAEIIMGSSPPGDTYNEAGIGTPLVNGPVEFGEYFAIKRKWTTEPGRLSKPNDLIFCVRGSTTGRRVVADGVYCLGRGVCSIRSKTAAWAYIYQLVDFCLDRLLSRVSGSVFPNLNGPDLKQFDVVIPNEAVVEAYQRQAQQWIDLIATRVRESANLAATRDALLPKLLSGELLPERSL